MSDEDEREINLEIEKTNTRRLTMIKSKLQELTREKSKYNLDKLTQDLEFLQSEMGHLSHSIADLNREIIHQISVKKNLNAKMAILRSNSGHHFPSSEIALRDKERYEEEFKKPNKSEVYRELARRQIKSICEALPQLQIQDEYTKNLQLAEDAQILAQKKREKFQENLNTKSRKQTELKQLLNDSSTKLPQLETAIKNLRLERDEILSLITDKKQQCKPLVSPQQSFEHDTLQNEKQRATEQYEKVRLLLNYFHEKLSTTTIDSPSENSIEYKKEFSADILDKYAGKSNNKKEQTHHSKKNRRKNYSPQMIALYNDVRILSDTLPIMPLYDYQIPSIIKSLQSYLSHQSDEDIQDSALDTFSETSSLMDSNEIPKDLIPNIPEARSSSSSDDKKTIVSSSSATSSQIEQSIVPLTPVEELPSLNIPIERQISDEGYRSVRNEQSSSLIRSKSYDSTEKVGQWLTHLQEKPPQEYSFQSTDNQDEPILRYTCD